MNKSKIEWLKNPDGSQGYSINPVKGLCPMACSYCYARRMYKRFKWNPEIRFDWLVANDLPKMKAGSKVFWGSTMELFGNWVDAEWLRLIFEAVKHYSDLTHIFLTKQPHNLSKWSPFPKNCWVGVSATDAEKMYWAVSNLQKIQAKVKFLSLEPLLSWKSTSEWLANPYDDFLHCGGINWIIIGSQTQPVRHPPREWVTEIISAADKAQIPVFVKEPLASHYGLNRKEMPKR